jgi:hypothetical protein
MAREIQHVVELGGVAPLPPDVVVPVLPTSRDVGPDRLQVPVRVRADPYVAPRRWNGQRTQALELVGVGDLDPRWSKVLEAPAASPAGDAGPRRVRAT